MKLSKAEGQGPQPTGTNGNGDSSALGIGYVALTHNGQAVRHTFNGPQTFVWRRDLAASAAPGQGEAM